VAQHVGPLATQRGLQIVSTSALLTIPQQAFVDGREIELETDKYALAEPFLDPPIQLTAKVRIAKSDDLKRIFASALVLHENLEKPVKDAIGRAVRARLRKCSAVYYYGSAIVNGLPVRLGGNSAVVMQADAGEGVHRQL